MARTPNSAGASTFARTSSTTVCVSFEPHEPARSHRAPRAARARPRAEEWSGVAMADARPKCGYTSAPREALPWDDLPYRAAARPCSLLGISLTTWLSSCIYAGGCHRATGTPRVGLAGRDGARPASYPSAGPMGTTVGPACWPVASPSPFLRSWWLRGAGGHRRCFLLVVQDDRLLGGLALEEGRRLGLPCLRMMGSAALAQDHLDLLAGPGTRTP